MSPTMPSLSELRTYPTEYILKILITKSSNSITRVLQERFTANDPLAVKIYTSSAEVKDAVKILTKDDFQSPTVSEKEKPRTKTGVYAPDIRPLCQGDLKETRPLAQMILSSDWDYIDPKGRMTTSPEDVVEFLQNLMFRPQSYEKLPEKAQNLLNAIIDSYGRWWRLQHPGE
jgi:hypothetical protein